MEALYLILTFLGIIIFVLLTIIFIQKRRTDKLLKELIQNTERLKTM